MPIDFPNSPTTNATYTINGQSWRYNGTGWVKTTLNVNIPTQTGNSGRYLTTDGTTVSWAVGTPGYTGSRGQDGVIGYNGSVGYTGSAGPSSITAINNQQNTGTSALGLPAGTTAQRPGTAYNGYARINTDTTFLEIYYNGSWISAASLSVVPGAPTIGLATATGPTTATVAFTAPSNNGGGAITSYTAVSSPGGITATLSQAGSGTITVTGLSGGTAYTFVVYATNSVGNSANSGPSNSITTPLPAASSVEYLVVAGGGGGGADVTDGRVRCTGGGGAGGYRTATGYAVTTGSPITVTIGGGGAGGNSTLVTGTNGTNSVFGSITSTGGGGGGGHAASAPYQPGANTGGSGGGDSNGKTGKAGTAGQGNAGGNGGPDATPFVGGGGGGAGSVGGNASSPYSGNGGAGLNWNSLGTFYAGGGGGGSELSNAGSGGSSIGGNGAVSPAAGGNASPANRGSGGGGGATTGGSGSSGIVILRYADAYAAAESSTGSPTITTSGGYRYYTWTGSGSITF